MQLRDNTPAGNPDGQVDQDVDDLEVTQGVSYSYGDIDTPEQFAVVVNQPNIANWRNYTNGHKPGKTENEHAYWQEGQRNPANFTNYSTTWPETGTIIISYDFNLLSPAMWGGIDCNGFVQRIINKAEGDSQDLGVDTRVRRIDTIDDKKPRAYFTETERAFTFATNNNSLIHKGDLVQYNTHIAIIYSSRWGDSQFRTTLGTMYDVLHAYGDDGYDNDGRVETAEIFSRKAMITGSNIANPNRFGRIKLW